MSRRLCLIILACTFVAPSFFNAQEKTMKVEEQKSFNVIGLAVRTNNQQEASG